MIRQWCGFLHTILLNGWIVCPVIKEQDFLEHGTSNH